MLLLLSLFSSISSLLLSEMQDKEIKSKQTLKFINFKLNKDCMYYFSPNILDHKFIEKMSNKIVSSKIE